MKKLVAFHGKQSVKNKYIARVLLHRKLDHLVQGVGWESNGDTKGCAVGCTLEKYDHKSYETELGIPEMVARFEDCIFEGLPSEKAMEWPERFLSAIKPGADLSMVGVRFLLEINRRNFDRLDAKWKKVLSGPICQVIEVLEDWLKTGKANESAAWSAWSAAWSAESARSAARSAAESAARSAAESAAESAAWSARSAAESAGSAAWWSARSAAESAAWSAAGSAEYEWMAQKLIELLKAA